MHQITPWLPPTGESTAHGAQVLERSKERGADGGKVPSTPRFSNAHPG